MGGRELVGIVSITGVRELPREAWAETPVERIMTPVPLKTVAADADRSRRSACSPTARSTSSR
jgi:CBS domain-containing protein